jgi:hypothetical protein
LLHCCAVTADARLNQTNIGNNNNKSVMPRAVLRASSRLSHPLFPCFLFPVPPARYYNIQLLEADAGGKFFVWNRYSPLTDLRPLAVASHHAALRCAQLGSRGQDRRPEADSGLRPARCQEGVRKEGEKAWVHAAC